MYKLTVGLLIFIAGWGLGWYAHDHRGTAPIQFAPPAIPALSESIIPGKPAADSTPATPDLADDIARLLRRNKFEAVLERYESSQRQAGDTVVAEFRVQILSHARRLIADHRFSLAEKLLQSFLVAAYRDVEARTLLAEAYLGQKDFSAAIDQLYEARGYAYRPAALQRITGRIRTLVAGLTQSLKGHDDHSALLALYQQLIQLEPGYAPWFIELATTQLALEDKAAARRSLLLVSQDPGVGAQAQAMLSGPDLAPADMQDTESQRVATDVTGIPLRRRGNHFYVAARPSNGRSIQLLIDTGASLTIFTPEVLEQRGIRYQDTGRTGIFNTANGPVRAPVYTLEALSVGEWQVGQLDIGVLDLGEKSGMDGLLGMNFLRHFQFFIDQNEAVLRLTAN